MGTNTFHLLVAKIGLHSFEIMVNDRSPVRIGVGGINQNMITKAGMERAVEAMKKIKLKLDLLVVDQIFAFGTSALRNAKNGTEVVLKIKEATGIETKIISGDEEANYIYEGVNFALNLKEEKTLIMDIGGGSVEFIIGNGKGIFWKQSLEIGAQRLLERFQKHDPILPSEIQDLNLYFKEALSPLVKPMKIYSPRVLAGSSGTFDTLSEMYCLQTGSYLQASPETPFDLAAFEKIYGDLISKNRAERMQMPGMVEMRVEMIVVACCLINFVIHQFSFDRIRVSSYSLKEGVLAAYLNR